MQIPYRYIEKIKINQESKDATTKQMDDRHAVFVILPEKPGKAVWDRVAHAETIRARLRRRRRQDPDCRLLSLDLPNRNGTRVWLQLLDKDSSTFECLGAARTLAAAARDVDPGRVLVQIAGFSDATAARIGECTAAALLAGVCPMPSYKSEQAPDAALARISLCGLADSIDLPRLRAEVMGNHLARWLAAQPANKLTPGSYRQLVSELATSEGWRMQFLDRKALARKNAGAFLAVVQASPVEDAGIVHLRYRPKGRARRKLALVGKGICFDTGGVNVKPAKYMNGMHEDMQGSAVALGTLLALSRLDSPWAIDCWLALAENHIGSKAYKPNDVITACNGTTIEVKHTDAEGRMVLADTLALASREKPRAVIDYATLTGACIYSLSSRYSGVFTNRPALNETLIAAGRDSGERVWPFPQDEDFDEALKSDVADTLQCTLEGEADHILAARFLNRFVGDDSDWVHVDLAASNRKGGLGHIATDTTGFGVRFTLNLLLQQDMLDTTWN